MESDPPFVKEIDAKAAAGDEACKAAARCLQAMRSVICQSKCATSATAYFAATLTTLHAHLEKKGHQENPEATATALLLVLRRAITSVPATVAASRLNDIVDSMMPIFRNVKTTEESLVRQALGCLAAAAEAAYNGGSRPNRKVLKPMFNLLSDDRGAVRRQAGHAAAHVLRRAGTSDQQTAEFATQHMAQILASAKVDKKAPDDLPAQHVVELLRSVAGSLPAESLTGLCEALVRLPAQLGQHPCCTSAFEFLAGHLATKEAVKVAFAKHQDPAQVQEQQEHRAALAAKLLPGLLTVPVNLLNVAYISAYAKALGSAVAALAGTTPPQLSPKQVAMQKLSGVKRLLGLFTERDPTLQRATREACLALLAAAGERDDLALLEELPEVCRPLLGYESKAAWPQSLPVIAGVFDALGAARTRVSPAELATWTAARFGRSKSLLEELVAARDKARGGELSVFGKELSQCLCSAVSTFGPEHVLSAAPMQLLEHSLSEMTFEQQSRSWLLLILKESCKRTNLAFFATRMLPLAAALKSRAAEAEQVSAILARKYMTLMEQVWALLPGFCQEAVDLPAAMLAEGGKLAKQLVAVLVNEPELREYVWVAFTRACEAVHQPPSPLSQALKEANQTCLRTLSSRVMPEMFSAFIRMHIESEGKDPSRVSHARYVALKALESYARIADAELVGSFFKNIVARLLKATTETSLESANASELLPLGDLANALLPHLPAEYLDLALKVFTPILNSADDEKGSGVVLQKAAYRAMRNVLQHPATSKMNDPAKVLGLWATLRDSRQTCTATATKARLQAMNAMLLLMQERLAMHLHNNDVRQEFVKCLTTILPEVLFHLRDQGSTTRELARDCLHVAVTTALHQEMQAEVVTLLSAGLAGLSRHAKAVAIDALSRVHYEHSHIIEQHLQDRLANVVLLLLEDSDAQVWRAALKFTKVIAYVAPKESLMTLLPQIMKLFKNPHLGSAKMLVRKIIERLVKVLSAEVLSEAFPKAHLPLLHYIQRMLARRQRPAGMRARATADGEDKEKYGKRADEEEDVDMEGTGHGKKQTWDEFQAGDEVDPGEEQEAEPSGNSRKRTRGAAGKSEPPTSPVMAHEAVQALLDAWEAESDSDEEGGGRRRRGRGGEAQTVRGKRKRDAVEASTWIHEDRDVPLDFMSADAAHSVLTVRPPPQKRQRAKEVGGAGAENRTDALRRSGLRFAEDGRLIVSETAEANEAEGENKASKFNIGADTKKLKPLSKLAALRVQRAQAKAKAKAERRGGHLIKGLESYKPGKKRAQGDAKRKGTKLEPFAYVRLNPKVTKERYKDKAVKSFEKVVQGAKKGVLKGLKAKARDTKLRQAKEARKQKQRRNKTYKPGAR